MPVRPGGRSAQSPPAYDGSWARILFILWAGGAAFAVYFAMYAFRKPFAAASYLEVGDWHFALDFKITLVIAQVAGYALSKFIGIKTIAEMDNAHRARAIIALIALAWLALVAFAILPATFKPLALFCNGLPLGLIWGLVFGYVEGRRVSDILGAMLCASFIVSSGVVKSVGSWLMVAQGVPDFWMPAATGALFFPLLAISTCLLSRLPPPDQSDVDERVQRQPMDRLQRLAFLRQYWSGMLPLVLAYVIFTLLRDFRDNFAAELWAEMGFDEVSSLFTSTEAPIAALVLCLLAGFVAIKDNRRALLAINITIFAGSAAILASTFAFQQAWLSPYLWMTLSGAGLYLAYTPFNAILFDRLIAATRTAGNAGFLIYMADASGYAGSVSLMLVRNFIGMSTGWVSFLEVTCYVGGAASIILMAIYSITTMRQVKPDATDAAAMPTIRACNPKGTVCAEFS